MDAVRKLLRWMGAKLRQFNDLAGGEDLHDAQMNRGDYHEFKSIPGA